MYRWLKNQKLILVLPVSMEKKSEPKVYNITNEIENLNFKN